MADITDEEKERLINEKLQRITELETKMDLASRKKIVAGKVPKGKNSSKKQYTDNNVDLDSLAIEIEDWFKKDGYITQSDKSADGLWLIQATKESWARMVFASKRAFNVLIEGGPNNFSVSTGVGSWITNLAALGVIAVLTGGLYLLFAGASAAWSKKIQNDLDNFIDQRILFSKKPQPDYKIEDAVANNLSDVEKRIEIEKQQMNKKLKSLDDALIAGVIDNDECKHKKTAFKDNFEKFKKLEYLKDAKDKGVLSELEFEEKKANL